MNILQCLRKKRAPTTVTGKEASSRPQLMLVLIQTSLVGKVAKKKSFLCEYKVRENTEYGSIEGWVLLLNLLYKQHSWLFLMVLVNCDYRFLLSFFLSLFFLFYISFGLFFFQLSFSILFHGVWKITGRKKSLLPIVQEKVFRNDLTFLSLFFSIWISHFLISCNFVCGT